MRTQFTWERATPESQRMSQTKLDEMRAELEARGTKAFLVIRNDRIVYEWYAPDHGPRKKHYGASLDKAVVGGTSLMLALNDGRIAVDDPASKYVPAWKNHPLKAGITIRHLATHSCGVENASEKRGLGRGRAKAQDLRELPGWKGAFWRQEPNPFTIARDQAPMIFAPGSEYAYSNTGMAMLAYAVTAAIQGSSYKDIRTLLRERILGPIGVADEEWSIGYGKTFETDGLPLVPNWGGGSYTARALARVGRLMLRRGDWEGSRLVDSAWVDEVTHAAGTPVPEDPRSEPGTSPGLGWWTNASGAFSPLPLDAYWGHGAGNQILVVVPILDLIVVRFGAQLADALAGGAHDFIFKPLMEAILPPCSPSAVISGIEWDPPSKVMRQCYLRGKDGSDNWPTTWADDDVLYTAYGDGWGFEGDLPEKKLSMGVARVLGNPPGHRGENVRSNAEFLGPGKSGKKASGMLSVAGVLYMWVRNANEQGEHCRLGWSSDHAKTWSWADWAFEELGYCTFLNFGKDYAGARDNFVYVYSHDHPSAYTAVGRFILARAPKDRIADRTAYEFLTGLDSDGNPSWSRDIAKRGAVFTHRNRCLRSGVSYNKGLGRYLWWQQLPNHLTDAKTRFFGGFSVYDAPEPWGPWTCLYYSEGWDVGPGETGHFPPRWMSKDGRTVHLVFSGDDTFAVRRGKLMVTADG